MRFGVFEIDHRDDSKRGYRFHRRGPGNRKKRPRIAQYRANHSQRRTIHECISGQNCDRIPSGQTFINCGGLVSSALWWGDLAAFAKRSEIPRPAIEIVPLAGLAGFESEAAFSPDGNHVAFVLHDLKNAGVYTTAVGSQKSLRLTSVAVPQRCGACPLQEERHNPCQG